MTECRECDAPASRRLQCVVAAVASIAWASGAWATSVDLDLAEQPLGQSLSELARLGATRIDFGSALVAGKTAPDLKGTFEVSEALARMLARSGLRARSLPDGGFAVVAEHRDDTAGVTLPTVTVSDRLDRDVT